MLDRGADAHQTQPKHLAPQLLSISSGPLPLLCLFRHTRVPTCTQIPRPFSLWVRLCAGECRAYCVRVCVHACAKVLKSICNTSALHTPTLYLQCLCAYDIFTHLRTHIHHACTTALHGTARRTTIHTAHTRDTHRARTHALRASERTARMRALRPRTAHAHCATVARVRYSTVPAWQLRNLATHETAC